MVWPKSDTTIGRALELYGEFAEGENEVMRRYLSHGDTAVDVGANVGTTALALAEAVGESGCVLAFEPQPLIAQCLSTALTLNERFNVRVHTAAVGAQQGWATLPAVDLSDGGNYGAVGIVDSVGADGARKTFSAPVMTVDSLELEACHLIKVDVEGYEWSVVQGAAATVQRHRPVLYLEAKRVPGTSAYLRFLLNQGWRCYWHFAFFFRRNNFRKQPDNIFLGIGDMNVLAVPIEQAQPDDLPEIRNSDEDWQFTYRAFFERRGLVPV